MKIDKTRREIIPRKIDNSTLPPGGLRADVCDFATLHDELEAVANSIGKNQAAIPKDHFLVELPLPGNESILSCDGF